MILLLDDGMILQLVLSGLFDVEFEQHLKVTPVNEVLALNLGM